MTNSAAPDHAGQIASFINTIAEENCAKNLSGIAIGVIVDGQEISATSGWADVDSQTPVSESTIFEIGSISKLFTSLLLAVATKKQEVALDDPVQNALGEQVTLPTDGKSQITYRSLANHRSSLPRLPDDLIATGDMENPYVHYDQEMLYANLNAMKSVEPIGSQVEYSNFGVGLLGHVLGKLAGSDYRTALKERVLMPLGMLNTSTQACDTQKSQLATVHKKKNEPTKHWDFTEVTVAAGGIRSSLADMCKFLRALINPSASELADEIELMRQRSTLPKFSGNKFSLFDSLTVVLAGVWILIFAFMDLGMYLFKETMPDPRFYLIALLTYAAALAWGWIAGGVTLGALLYLVGQFWGAGFIPVMSFVGGLSMLVMGSIGRSLRQDEDNLRGGGGGRLAWQTRKLGKHLMLWHNGKVGGSASFIGVVHELEVGVVVLTNTAESVEGIAVEIMSEILRLKGHELEAPLAGAE